MTAPRDDFERYKSDSRVFWLLLNQLLAAAVAMMGGCKPAAPKAAPPPIRVATFYWPGSYWEAIADQKGWFKEAGLNVQLVDCKGDYFASEQALAEGRLDANIVVLFDLLGFVTRGADLVGIINVDYSSGADKLVARPGLERLADLKGKKIALPQKTYLGYVLEVGLGRVGLASKDVEVVDVAAEEAPHQLVQGAVEAMLTFKPYATQGLSAVKGQTLFDTSQLPGLAPDTLVVSRKFIEQRRADVAALVQVWQRATTFIKEHPDEAFGIVATLNQKTPEEGRHFAQMDKILDRRNNQLAFSFAAGFDSLHGAVRQMNDFMLAKGTTDQKLDSSRFLDGSFVRALK